MTRTEAQFNRDLLQKLLDAAYSRARPAVVLSSRTLAAAMTRIIDSETQGRLYIPHYWSIYVHDGRGAPFGANKARVLVWFRNPNNDPRIRGGRFPERLSQVRRLTRQQFLFWLAENRAARKRGTPPPMIVARFVKNPTEGTLFFDNDRGMTGFLEDANRIAAKEMSQFAREFLGVDLEISDQINLILDF